MIFQARWKTVNEKGIKIVTGAKVLPDTLEKRTAFQLPLKRMEKETYHAEQMLVSIGRQPNIEGSALKTRILKRKTVLSS